MRRLSPFDALDQQVQFAARLFHALLLAAFVCASCSDGWEADYKHGAGARCALNFNISSVGINNRFHQA